jgi:N-acetylneuraminic acid mutarotase
VLKDNKIIFFRYTYPADKFDIYDIATNAWSVGVLPQHNIENASIIAVNNTIYIAGGDARNGTRTNQVFTLEF